MVPLTRFAFALTTLVSYVSATSAWARREDSPPLNCKEALVLPSKEEYDLSSLAGAHTVTRTRESPPTKMVDTVRFDLCADLTAVDGSNAEDQVNLAVHAMYISG